MKRYYYELMDEDYNSYEAAIPDGRIKARAIAQAKREPLLKQSEQ